MLSKKDREGLVHIMNNPTTGTPHNQHVVSSQVHTVFAIDSLEKTIKDVDKSNSKLQNKVLWLTYATVGLTVVEVIKLFI